MPVEDLLRIADISVSIAVLLFIGWRAEVLFLRILKEKDDLIDKLTNGDREEE